MKKMFLPGLFLAASLLTVSCNNDDSGSQNDVNYFPIVANSSHTYEYSRTGAAGNANGTVTTTLGSATNIEGNSYHVWSPAQNILGVQNEVPLRNAGNIVYFRPQLDLDGGGQIDTSFGETKAIDPNVGVGGLLDEKILTNSMPSIPISQSGIDGTVTPVMTLKLRSVHGAQLPSLQVSQSTMNNIYRTDLEMYMDIRLQFNVAGIPVTLPEHVLLNEFKFGDLKLFSAENTGVVRTEYDYSFDGAQWNTSVTLPVLGTVNIANDVAVFQEMFNSLEVSGNAQRVP